MSAVNHKMKKPAALTVCRTDSIENEEGSPTIIVSAPPLFEQNPTNTRIQRRRESRRKTFPLRKATTVTNLAKGYDEFRMSWLSLPPDFGEASSDDLSSEWASSETDKDGDKCVEEVSNHLIKLGLDQDRPTAKAKKGLISASWRKVQHLVKWTPFWKINPSSRG